MKQLFELNFPDSCRYSENHAWARMENDHVVIGMSDYAQDQLGDIVYIELPETGSTLEQGEPIAVESNKTVTELLLPLGGEVLEVNEKLEDAPELVNRAPYDEGWIVKIKPSDFADMDSLMSAEDYENFLESSQE